MHYLRHHITSLQLHHCIQSYRNSITQPLLEYACQLWHPHTVSDIKTFSIVQPDGIIGTI